MREDPLFSWRAPVVPGVSMAGIPLGMSGERFQHVLAGYRVGAHSGRYRFAEGPELVARGGIDEAGNGGYAFSLADKECVDELMSMTPALSVGVRDGTVWVIKAYDFSFKGDAAEPLIYQGKLPGGLGLGDKLSNASAFCALEFDDAEDWFCAQWGEGRVELSGWAGTLLDQPDQLITAIAVLI